MMDQAKSFFDVWKEVKVSSLTEAKKAPNKKEHFRVKTP